MNDIKENISEILKEKGNPLFWYDPWNNHSRSFAIWEFEEEILLDSSGCYINGIKTLKNPLIVLQKYINKWKLDIEGISAVGFFSYNFKKFLYPHIIFNNYKDNVPYFWFGKPKNTIFLNKEDNIIKNRITINPLNNISYNNYRKNIAKIKNSLVNGDVYQINYTYPKIFETFKDPFNIYCNLRNIAKPDFGYFIHLNSLQILSMSPEKFFTVSNNNIFTYPIKGTRPRSKNKSTDIKLSLELLNSNKDKAEHLMIVDLLRNDLGKICEYGSVDVTKLYDLKSYQTVHHLVTEIIGKLKPNIQEMNIIKALFPGGSITGAPKEKAMKIIDTIEEYSRGIYTGSIGYITSDNNMDFNIAIRTMTIQNNKATYPVGGGIVWDSKTLDEWEETNLKARVLNNIIIKKTKNILTYA